MAEGAWDFRIDRGGTITHVAGRAPDGRLHPFKVLAHSQGMNDPAVGKATCRRHATICAGSPAGRRKGGRLSDGASAVRACMADGRATGPEVPQMRFPVLPEGFRLRPGSEGSGLAAAGDDAERRIRFREAMDCAILSSHCALPARGPTPAGDGQTGATRARRGEASREVLAARAQAVVQPGEAAAPRPLAGGRAAASERP